MKNDSDFINNYDKLESPFSKSDDELWNEIDKQTSEKPKVKIFHLNSFRYAAAAAVILIMCSALFMRFYTTTISSPKGKHLTEILPDGSTVQLNADTEVKFNPYWWTFNRKVELFGEAYCDVVDGEKFNIVSKNGITEIVGTTFNIYSREEDYKVFCESGKVKVKSTKTDISFLLHPGELAVIDNIKREGNKTDANFVELLAWKLNRFAFTQAPLKNVFEELERQYDVKINLNKNHSRLLYSGNFDKTPTVESALNIVCKSFGLNFVKMENKAYNIVQ